MKDLLWSITMFVGTFILSFGTVCIIASCGGGGSGGGGSDSDIGTQGSVQEFTIESKEVGVTYGISVGLPPDYDESNSPYPSIFLLDADADPTGVTFFDSLFGPKYDLPEDYILIGINNTDRRNWDYLPVNTCVTGGGNVAFLNFLVSELVPLLDENYNIDPARRLLQGFSFGGDFVFYTLLTDNGDTFPNLLSIDATLSQCWDVNSLEQDYYSSNDSLPVIFYSSAATEGMADIVRPVMQRLSGRDYSGFYVKYDEFTGKHTTIHKRSYDAGFEWIDLKFQENSD